MAVYTFPAGDTRYIDFVVSLSGSPDDITGWTFHFTAKHSTADPDIDAVFQKTNGSGITLTDAANGELRVALVPADTEDLQEEGATLVYDLQAITDGDETYTVEDGTIVLEAAVTHTNTLP